MPGFNKNAREGTEGEITPGTPPTLAEETLGAFRGFDSLTL